MPGVDLCRKDWHQIESKQRRWKDLLYVELSEYHKSDGLYSPRASSNASVSNM